MSEVIHLKVSDEQVERALGLYDFGALRDSIMEGESNIYGAIGEVVVADYLKESGRNVKFVSTRDYDMTVNGRTVDVKTKRTTVPPLQNFNCSISAHNTTQKCDVYLFVRVHESKKEGWILGYMYKDEYFKKAKFFRRGQPDPKFPAWSFAADCYNLEISKLLTIK
jgi:hypothetical protein